MKPVIYDKIYNFPPCPLRFLTAMGELPKKKNGVFLTEVKQIQTLVRKTPPYDCRRYLNVYGSTP